MPTPCAILLPLASLLGVAPEASACADSLYRVEIVRGRGGGVFPADTLIELGAYLPEGATFTGWTLEGKGVITDPSNPASTFLTGPGAARLIVGLAYDSTALQIRAYGDCGSEGLTLQIDGRQVRVFRDVPVEPTTFYYGGPVGDEVRVWLNNAGEGERGCLRGLTVEYVEHLGARHLGAAQTLNTGQRNERGECVSDVGGRSAFLTCRGYIEFGTMAPPDTVADVSAVVEAVSRPEALALYPNPVHPGETVNVVTDVPAGELTILDVRGAPVYRETFAAHPGGHLGLALRRLPAGAYVTLVRGARGRLAVGRFVVAR